MQPSMFLLLNMGVVSGNMGVVSGNVTCKSLRPGVTDLWCDENCNASPPECPANLCKCSGQTPTPPPSPAQSWDCVARDTNQPIGSTCVRHQGAGKGKYSTQMQCASKCGHTPHPTPKPPHPTPTPQHPPQWIFDAVYSLVDKNSPGLTVLQPSGVIYPSLSLATHTRVRWFIHCSFALDRLVVRD